MAGAEKRAARPAVAVATAHRPASEAIEEMLAQLDYGEAPQIGVLGDTGCGKTTLILEIVEAYQRRSPGSVLVVDDKDLTTKFLGQQRRDVEDLIARPADWQQGRVIVFRGDVARGQRVDLEAIAELAWARVGKARKTLLVFDELIAGREDILCKNSQWRRGVKWVPQGFTMGRSPGVANLWGAQSPQDVPNEVFNQSSAIALFRMAGTGLMKLRERDYLNGGVAEVIPRLAGPPLPPAQRGEFVVLRRGQPWDGRIFKKGA